MKILVLNGSPRKGGVVARLLKSVVEGLKKRHTVTWINVYDLKIAPCRACMECRPDAECSLPEDDAHRVARRIRTAGGLIVGTPTHWGNMGGQLKLLFDRTVTVFIGENERGMPVPRHRGKPAVIVTACAAPWPFNIIGNESRGAITAVRKVLGRGGYRIIGTLTQPGTRKHPEVPPRMLAKGRHLGLKM